MEKPIEMRNILANHRFNREMLLDDEQPVFESEFVGTHNVVVA